MTPETTQDARPSAEHGDVSTNAQWRHDRFSLAMMGLIILCVGVLLILCLTLPALQPGETVRPQSWRDGVCKGIFLAVVTCFLAYLVLNQQSFSCPHCGKHLDTRDDWMCGYCDTVNKENALGLRKHMLDGCGNCSRKAQSMVCQHCHGAVCLNADGDIRHPAQRVEKKGTPPTRIIPTFVKPTRVSPMVVVDPQKEKLESLRREKQQIEQETEIMNARIALAMAESRHTEVKDASENRFKSVISRLVQPLEDKHQRRSALLIYGEKTRAAIDSRTDLTADQKSKLKEELDIDLEQAGLENA